MTVVNSHNQSTSKQKIPDSIVALICQKTFTFARIASLLYYID